MIFGLFGRSSRIGKDVFPSAHVKGRPPSLLLLSRRVSRSKKAVICFGPHNVGLHQGGSSWDRQRLLAPGDLVRGLAAQGFFFGQEGGFRAQVQITRGFESPVAAGEDDAVIERDGRVVQLRGATSAARP